MFWNRAEKKKTLLSEPRQHHYVFAHKAMREICAEDAPQFFAIIGSDDKDKFIAWIWGIAEKHVGGPAKDLHVSEIAVSTCRVRDHPTIIVAMPEPRALAEAHLVGIVLTGMPEKGATPGKVGFRYFTLERGSHLDGTARTVLCEWTDDAHLNFGDGPQAETEAFIHAIEQKL